MRQTKTIKAILFLLLAAGGLWYAYQVGHFGSVADKTGKITRIEIGGPFALTNQFGETVRDSDFHGRYMLVFFGYTFCPDVCPTTLTTISTALDILGDAASKVTPIFVTVDPERDTPEYLADYLQYFHPAIQGLSGSLDQIKNLAKVYGIYYEKGQEGGDTDDYLMASTRHTLGMIPPPMSWRRNLQAFFPHQVADK
jgi:protein SCO1/2